jgi:uncharacterized protein
MQTNVVTVDNPEGLNLIFGQSHFIKTVEDISEIMSVAGARFGVAFCEASGPCLIRSEGNDEELVELAVRNAEKVGAGHTFFVFMDGIFPIAVLNAIKGCPEVCRVFCATANPVEVVVCETNQGNGVLGVVDGFAPKGVEDEGSVEERKTFLRKIGYKY